MTQASVREISAADIVLGKSAEISKQRLILPPPIRLRLRIAPAQQRLFREFIPVVNLEID
jgi:hypothetical protein